MTANGAATASPRVMQASCRASVQATEYKPPHTVYLEECLTSDFSFSPFSRLRVKLMRLGLKLEKDFHPYLRTEAENISADKDYGYCYRFE